MKQRLTYHLKQRRTVIGLVLLALDGLFFSLTNPDKVPSVLLIVGFGLVALSIYYLFRLLLAVAAVYGAPLQDGGRRPALFLGISCSLAVALQSLGELTLRDLVVLALLTAIAYIYTSYGRASKREKVASVLYVL
jgi:hypothetical protein